MIIEVKTSQRHEAEWTANELWQQEGGVGYKLDIGPYRAKVEPIFRKPGWMLWVYYGDAPIARLSLNWGSLGEIKGFAEDIINRHNSVKEAAV